MDILKATRSDWNELKMECAGTNGADCYAVKAQDVPTMQQCLVVCKRLLQLRAIDFTSDINGFMSDFKDAFHLASTAIEKLAASTENQAQLQTNLYVLPMIPCLKL